MISIGFGGMPYNSSANKEPTPKKNTQQTNKNIYIYIYMYVYIQRKLFRPLCYAAA